MKHCGSWETANFTVNNATKVISPECRRTKRMKMNDGDESKMNNGLDRWSGNSDVEPDLLADMGLSILDDKSENRPDNFPPLVSGLRPCNALKKTCVTGVNSKEAVVDYFDSQMTQENIPTPESFFIFRRKKPTADDAFSKLSDEMVLTIFRHMPKKSLVRCAFVCKRWRRIAYDESLWSRLDLSLRTLRPGNLGYTLVRGVSILRLAQAEVSDPVFECASPLVTKEYDCKLQYLDLSMAVISKRGLADLLKCCRHLRKLSIEHCTVNKDICAAISLNSNLEVLNLSACYGLTEDSINTIITGCRKLSALNVGWTNLSEEALCTLSIALPHSLQRLNLSGCRKTLTDEHVKELVDGCPDLVELDMSDCISLTAETISHVCQLSKLEHLALSRCYSIPRSAYLELTSVSSLQFLDVFSLLAEHSLSGLQRALPAVEINKFLFSSIARPTVGIRRTSIWGLRVRD